MNPETQRDGTTVKIEITGQNAHEIVAAITGRGGAPDYYSAPGAHSQPSMADLIRVGATLTQGETEWGFNPTIPPALAASVPSQSWNGQSLTTLAVIEKQTWSSRLGRAIREHRVTSAILGITVAVAGGYVGYSYLANRLGAHPATVAAAGSDPGSGNQQVNLKTMLTSGTIANPNTPFAVAGVTATGTETAYYIDKKGKRVAVKPEGESLMLGYRQGIALTLGATKDNPYTISNKDGKTTVLVDLGKFTIGTKEEDFKVGQELGGTFSALGANRLVNTSVETADAKNADEAERINDFVRYPSDNVRLELENGDTFKDSSGKEISFSEMTPKQIRTVMYEMSVLAQQWSKGLEQIENKKCEGTDGVQGLVESYATNAITSMIREKQGDANAVVITFKGAPQFAGLMDREKATNSLLQHIPDVIDKLITESPDTVHVCTITGVK